MSPLPSNVEADSVAWITANAAAVVEDQQRRAESLQTRAAHVAGFAGATVALGAPLAKDALDVLSGRPEVAAGVFFFGGATALALTVFFSVFFVLRPIKHLAIGADEIENYLGDPRFVTSAPHDIQYRTLKALAKSARRYEKNNARKATFLRISAALYLIGLLAMISLAITLGIHYAWD